MEKTVFKNVYVNIPRFFVEPPKDVPDLETLV
jgi:hypothetical protein